MQPSGLGIRSIVVREEYTNRDIMCQEYQIHMHCTISRTCTEMYMLLLFEMCSNGLRSPH